MRHCNSLPPFMREIVASSRGQYCDSCGKRYATTVTEDYDFLCRRCTIRYESREVAEDNRLRELCDGQWYGNKCTTRVDLVVDPLYWCINAGFSNKGVKL